MRKTLIATGVGAAILLAGCGSSSSSGTSNSTTDSGGSSAPVTLRLGFLENITHASALVGIKEGYFTKDLGKNVTLKTTIFSSGTQEATALLLGVTLDLTGQVRARAHQAQLPAQHVEQLRQFIQR